MDLISGFSDCHRLLSEEVTDSNRCWRTE